MIRYRYALRQVSEAFPNFCREMQTIATARERARTGFQRSRTFDASLPGSREPPRTTAPSSRSSFGRSGDPQFSTQDWEVHGAAIAVGQLTLE